VNRKLGTLVLAVLSLTATGCSKSAPRTMMSAMVTAVDASTAPYIAERDKLEIITPESDLQKSWESAIAFCSTIQCEIVSSSITTRTADSVPSGAIALRVAPADLNKLLANLDKLGRIEKHSTEREDKTTEVVDTEAKIKNLTTFRDSLRAMLARPTATVSDLVQIQKQLTDTQSDLDSETSQRKILANETEKIAVDISFRVERSNGNGGGFAQVWNALRESGSILADSTASLITTIVAIIPWLILIVPATWLLVKGWKRLRLRRNISPRPPSTT
jgi:uncharacterized protein DUF4349